MEIGNGVAGPGRENGIIPETRPEIQNGLRSR